MTLSRRRFIESAAALYALPLASRRAKAASADLEVAIIGGGVSGAYSAWRLKTNNPQLRVQLFELSDRIGGRLLSVAFPQAPHLIGEAGGMRFLKAHRHVFPLAKRLGLTPRGYPMQLPTDRLYLRGRGFSYAEMGQATKLYPYNIPAGEQDPKSDYFMRAIERIVPGARNMTRGRWMKQRATVRFKGRLLKDWAAWALLANVLSGEEMAFGQAVSGYDDIALYETGLDEFDYLFLDDDEARPFYTVAGGYQHLPQALVREAQKLGVKVAMQARLVSLALPAAKGGAFRLAFLDRIGRRVSLTASRVVLALPRRALETIPESPFRKDAALADLIASVVPVPACKALLLYPKPWWRDLGIPGGRSVTDLPGRMFFALGAETERLPSESANGHGMLMMYCDANSVEYWKELAPPARPDAAGFNWLSGDSELANEMHREASLLYAATPPRPIAACFQDWTAEPFGGGWHYWGPGRDAFALADRIMKPLPGCDLTICGEAYGTYAAGWVEGALERAETMLQRHFGLAAAAWL